MNTVHSWSDSHTRESLGVALFGAAALHALIILGISFDIHRGDPPEPERTLDVTLVPPKEILREKPKDPEFLAQISQQGGAERQADERPAAPPSPPAVKPKPKPKREIERSGAPQPQLSREKPLLTTTNAKRKEVRRDPKPPVRAPARPDVAQLLASTQQEIDRLTSELDRRSVNASRKLRRKAINASTQEYKYSVYLEAWRKKVERIGNLNYPDEAKSKKLYGNLMLHVAIRTDGSVDQIRLVRSSGHKILDDAAIRIVELASPYAPLPPDIRDEVDILDITRTWQFQSGNRLFAR